MSNEEMRKVCDNENPKCTEEKNKIHAEPVEALIDKIVFKTCQLDVAENKIQVWKEIRKINHCVLDIKCQDIYVSKRRNSWIVFIEYKLIIEFITCWGFKHVVEKTFIFEKEIPFPLTCKDDHGLIDFSKAKPYLELPRAECVKVSFENKCDHAIIRAVVEFKIKVLATIKKDVSILTVEPQKDF